MCNRPSIQKLLSMGVFLAVLSAGPAWCWLRAADDRPSSVDASRYGRGSAEVTAIASDGPTRTVRQPATRQHRPLSGVSRITATPTRSALQHADPVPAPLPAGMVVVPAGEYEMGDHHNMAYPDESPIHAVYVDSLLVGVCEVTNRQYADALNWALSQQLIYVSDGVVYGDGGSTPYCDTTLSSSFSRVMWSGSAFSVYPGKQDHPMARVSWYGAAAYANWRSTREGRQPCYDLATWSCSFSNDGYRLPTEAEWEFAARGGLVNPKYSWGNSIDGSKANYDDSGDPWETAAHPRTSPVAYYDGNQIPPGTDMANGYGLYDMCGNLYEWCNDWYDSSYYSSSPYDNPQGPASGTGRVLRGGSQNSYVTGCRCANRYRLTPDTRLNLAGFRLVLGAD